MGRGRQKAKHTKVARELKYFSPNTDYSELEAELSTSENPRLSEDLDKWSEYADTGASEDDGYGEQGRSKTA